MEVITNESIIVTKMQLKDLRTPAFLIDLSKLQANSTHMIRKAEEYGVKLRPHVKTHKTIEAAKYQLGDSLTRITVSTLAEAFFYQENGFQDITYAFPITRDKLDNAALLTRKLKHFHILLDQYDTFEKVQEYGYEHDITFSVYLIVDSGARRAGVNPEDPRSLQLARALQEAKNIYFQGILTHAGQSYHCKTIMEVKKVAEIEHKVMVRFAEQIRSSGIECREVSIGSTPTCMHADNWEGVTEIRPGNYVFFDKFQSDIGSCSLSDCSASVLTRVVGHYPDHNRMLIDAGALALSKDQGATHILDEVVYGFVKNHPELNITRLSQEHGFIESDDTIQFSNYPIGSFLEIIPNHSCLTAALFPVYHVVDNDQVLDEWKPVRGW
ncbi:MAG TPA: alanine racemase [Balneolales bacterium]|nr:alanine racemase [Balneolales bacterium]